LTSNEDAKVAAQAALKWTAALRCHRARLAPAQPSCPPSDSDQALTDSDLAALNNVLQAVVAERIHLQELWEQAVSAHKTLLQQRGELMADYQNKQSTFKPDHPDMLRLTAQINQIDQEIKSDVIKQSPLKTHYEAMLQQEVLLSVVTDCAARVSRL